jgi:hypothetical protein
VINLSRTITLLALSAVQGIAVAGGSFHVTPGGSANSHGTRAHPWSLEFALSHPKPVGPGDTIWVHGGTYAGAFTSTLQGAPGNPIVVRRYPGEQVVLDNPEGVDGFVLYTQGAYTWFWGFEVRNSSASMINNPGVSMDGPGQKLINLVIHDHPGSGITCFSSAADAEVYGCLIYYNGSQTSVPGKAYGIYTQNDAATPKTFRENIVPFSWSFGLHAYTEGNRLDRFVWEGNVIYNSGILWRGSQFERNFFLGSAKVVASDDTFRDNHSYYPEAPSAGARNTFGYFAGTRNLALTGNWFVGGVFEVTGEKPTIRENTFYRTRGPVAPGNTELDAPSGIHVFVRPNAFDKGRANIIIYNWDRAPTVRVDASGTGLTQGEKYEVRDALNWPGLPLTTGTYTGDSIAIPMTGLFPAMPYRTPAVRPEHTAPEFGVFIILRAAR